MQNERWKTIESLYLAAADLEKSARARFLENACQGDGDLQREIESLLLHDELDGSSLDRQAPYADLRRSTQMIGTKLAHYEITAHLASGGMGDVYQATDTKLCRSVAIKFLPEAFTDDSERVARFQREARVLASLNHPNIAAIYGVDEIDSRHFLVMELITGETLADRIKRGAIPIEEALRIAKQIAEALEAAHEKGILHRDLKPGNIKITPEGTVKVLDFGLAKTLQSNPDATSSDSPTLSMTATQSGVILGTAAYMSPEQVKGRGLDKRSDLWSFGCVLYEMLTGKSLFDGDDVTDMFASVLRTEPDWSSLPRDLPRSLRIVIQRCLAKDRTMRIGDIAVVKFLLSDPGLNEELSENARPAPQRLSRLRSTLLIATAVLLGVVLIGVFFRELHPPITSPSMSKFSVLLAQGQTVTGTSHPAVAISPDGTQLVYVSNSRLYRRQLSDLEAKPIPGTEIKQGILNPIFSPDSKSIAFYSPADGTIKRIDVAGGTAVTICPAMNLNAMTWSPEGIVFAQPSEGIFRVSPDVGRPERLITIKEDEVAGLPQLLPGGQAVLFTLAKRLSAISDRWDKAQIVVQSLKTGERKPLIEGSDARYLPTGHVVYALGGIILAVPFDLRQQQITGGPVPVVEGIRRTAANGVAQMSVSDTGTLIYIPGPAAISGRSRTLMITDRSGSTTQLPLPSAPYLHPRVSRDGKQITVGTDDGREANVWIYDLSTTSPVRRLTFEGRNRFPIWSPDGLRVAFQSDREGDRAIFVQSADGKSAPVRLTKPEQDVSHVPESWAPDDKTILFSEIKGAAFALWTLSLEEKKATLFADVQSTQPIGATFSPDGHWIAYSSNARAEAAGTPSPDRGVYIQPFPATGTHYQVPKEYNDFHPAWGATAEELFYIPRAGRLSVVSVQTQPKLTFGKAMNLDAPAMQDRLSNDVRDYDVMPDGRSISTMLAPEEGGPGTNAAPQIVVVLNWFSELQRHVTVK